MTIQGISSLHPRGLIGQMDPIKPPTTPLPKQSENRIGNFGHGIEGFAGFDNPTAIDKSPSTSQATEFSHMLGSAVNSLSQAHATADVLAEQAATGDLRDIHDYMIASTQAQIKTEFAVQVRNRAVEAFNDVMRMQL